MKHEILIAVTSSLIGALIAFLASSSLGLFEKNMKESQVREVATLLIDDDTRRELLLEKMAQSGKFRSDQGTPGQPLLSDEDQSNRDLTARSFYVGYFIPEDWGSRSVRGRFDGWQRLWEGQIEIPVDAVDSSGNALMIVSLGGHGHGEHCYFSILIDGSPSQMNGRGASLVHPNGAVPNFWMNAAYVNFAVVQSGTHTLSVAVANGLDNRDWTCALNGARLSYAIFSGAEIVERPLITVPHIR